MSILKKHCTMIIKKFQGTDAQLYALVAPLVMDVAVIRKNNNYPFKTSDNHLWFVALNEGKVIGFMPVENRLNKMYIDNYYVEEDSEKLLTAFIEKAIEEFAHEYPISAMAHIRHVDVFRACGFVEKKVWKLYVKMEYEVDGKSKK